MNCIASILMWCRKEDTSNNRQEAILKTEIIEYTGNITCKNYKMGTKNAMGLKAIKRIIQMTEFSVTIKITTAMFA